MRFASFALFVVKSSVTNLPSLSYQDIMRFLVPALAVVLTGGAIISVQQTDAQSTRHYLLCLMHAIADRRSGSTRSSSAKPASSTAI